MVPVLLVLALLIAILAVIFALQNTALVAVTFLVWKFEQSLALVLLLAVAAGVLVGLLTLLPANLRQRFQLSGQRKKIEGLEKNLNDMKLKEEARLKQEAEKVKPAVQPIAPSPSTVSNQDANPPNEF